LWGRHCALEQKLFEGSSQKIPSTGKVLKKKGGEVGPFGGDWNPGNKQGRPQADGKGPMLKEKDACDQFKERAHLIKAWRKADLKRDLQGGQKWVVAERKCPKYNRLHGPAVKQGIKGKKTTKEERYHG